VMRLRIPAKSKGTGKPMILVSLFDFRFLIEFAAVL